MAKRRGKTKSSSTSDNGPTRGNVGTPKAATGDNDRSSDLNDLFTNLSLVEPRERMSRLDAGLAKHCEQGKHIKKHIKGKGICLSDCQPYGTGLKQVLRSDPNKRVRKQDAKDFPYVKKCLVFLG